MDNTELVLHDTSTIRVRLYRIQPVCSCGWVGTEVPATTPHLAGAEMIRHLIAVWGPAF